MSWLTTGGRGGGGGPPSPPPPPPPPLLLLRAPRTSSFSSSSSYSAVPASASAGTPLHPMPLSRPGSSEASGRPKSGTHARDAEDDDENSSYDESYGANDEDGNGGEYGSGTCTAGRAGVGLMGGFLLAFCALLFLPRLGGHPTTTTTAAAANAVGGGDAVAGEGVPGPHLWVPEHGLRPVGIVAVVAFGVAAGFEGSAYDDLSRVMSYRTLKSFLLSLFVLLVGLHLLGNWTDSVGALLVAAAACSSMLAVLHSATSALGAIGTLAAQWGIQSQRRRSAPTRRGYASSVAASRDLAV